MALTPDRGLGRDRAALRAGPPGLGQGLHVHLRHDAPFEDFVETGAHHLHVHDVVNGVWVPLSTALNMVNRSMGKDDLYPFVIAPPVLDKLDFVASLAAPG